MDSQVISENKTSKVKTFFMSLSQELKVGKLFWFQMLACLIATLSLFVAFFYEPFYLVSAIVFMGLILANFFIDKSNRLSGLNILMYFLSFSAVMRLPGKTTSIFAYGIVLFLVLVAINWLLDLKNRQKTINWELSIPFGLTLAFFLLKWVLGHYSITYCASICSGVVLLYFVCVYIKNINLKQTLFALVIGMLMCCILGIFSNYYPTLVGYFANSNALGVIRYSALFPNTNAYSMNMLLCLACLCALFLSKKINYIFYPIFLALMAISLTTLSKMVFIVLAVMIPILLVMNYFRQETKKQFFVSSGVIVLTVITAIGLQFVNFSLIFQRIADPFKSNNTQKQQVELKEEESVISQFTTGRTELWMNCLEKIFDEPKDMIIGHNRGRDYDMAVEGFKTESSPHNTYLQCVYHVGLLGAVLIGLTLLILIKKDSIKRFNKSGIVYLATMLLCFCALDNFSYMGYIFISLGVMMLSGEKEREKEGFYMVDKQKLEVGEIKIPKTIHYIWLGGNPLPKIAEKCMESWKKYCPDYEIKRWDESNLNIDITPYCRQAYEARKFAFASDVLRFDILNREGGIYLDIDVEIIKNIDKFLENEFFCGFESEHLVNPGIIMGSVPNHKILKSTLEGYKTRKFALASDPGKQETVCQILTSELEKFGFSPNNSLQKYDDFTVYPIDYFCPKSLTDGKIRLTKNSHAIHHFAATWVSSKNRFKSKLLQLIKRIMGQKLTNFLKNLKNKRGKEQSMEKSTKLKVLNLLGSNKYSGAENVVCQIIDMFGDEFEFAYCSPDGPIRESLQERGVPFIAINKKSVKEVKRVIKEFKPDVIHAHDLMAISLAHFASKKLPLVAHIHNNNPKFRKRSVRSLLFKYIATRKKTKKVLWVSNSCYDDFVYKNNVKINQKSLVLNNIINTQKLAEKADGAELSQGSDLAYIGRIAYQKNPERLCEIVALVKKQLPNISLAVIGDGDMKEGVEKLAKELGVDENIKFYGFLSNGYAILRNSKIFLMTSRFEGNPMCVLEAQSFGLPIVTTSIEELKTLVKHNENGYMYITNEEAAECIIKLLQDKTLYETMKKNTKDFSVKYNDAEAYKQVLRKIYEEE